MKQREKKWGVLSSLERRTMPFEFLGVRGTVEFLHSYLCFLNIGFSQGRPPVAVIRIAFGRSSPLLLVGGAKYRLLI